MTRTARLALLALVALLAVLLTPVGPATAEPAPAAPPAGSSAAASPTAPVPGLARAGGSVIGYQCGEGVCLLDPDAAQVRPTTVVPDGRFAGVTANGRTVAWVQPTGELVTAPTAGGTPTVVFDRADEGVGFQPVMSPDGTQFVWQFPVPIAGFYYTYRYDVPTDTYEPIAACACVVTHGWAGRTVIGAFPTDNGRPSRICRMDTGGESSCLEVLASAPAGQIAFPDGSADGSTFVASIDADGSEFGGVDGPITLFTGGAPAKTLTTGAEDVTPTLAPAGDRVAFERAGQIVVVDVATGAERVLAPGVYPSWGGSSSTATASGAALASTRLAVKRGRVVARVSCEGTKACTGRLVLARKGTRLATGRYRVKAGATRAVRLAVTKPGRARLLKGRGSVKAVLTVKPARGEAVRVKVRVRR